MEGTVFQRIKVFLEVNQISLNSLAKTLNMNQSTVLRQVKGEQTLSSTLVENFLEAFPDVSAEWIMRGKGSMYTEYSYRNAPISAAASMPDVATDPVQAKESDGIWKAKYEAIKECYDSLLASLGGVIGKRNVG